MTMTKLKQNVCRTNTITIATTSRKKKWMGRQWFKLIDRMDAHGRQSHTRIFYWSKERQHNKRSGIDIWGNFIKTKTGTKLKTWNGFCRRVHTQHPYVSKRKYGNKMKWMDKMKISYEENQVIACIFGTYMYIVNDGMQMPRHIRDEKHICRWNTTICCGGRCNCCAAKILINLYGVDRRAQHRKSVLVWFRKTIFWVHATSQTALHVIAYGR